MATLGLEEVTENAIRVVARDCGSLSIECSDVAGYVERIGPNRWRLVMPAPAFESKLDVLELTPGGVR